MEGNVVDHNGNVVGKTVFVDEEDGAANEDQGRAAGPARTERHIAALNAPGRPSRATPMSPKLEEEPSKVGHL